MVVKKIFNPLSGVLLSFTLLTVFSCSINAATLSSVSLQELANKPVTWAFAFYDDPQRQNPINGVERFSAEFDNLALRYRIAGQARASRALQQWRAAIQSLKKQGRVPINLDPAWLMAHPRQDRSIDHAITVGYCQPLDTVFRWGTSGAEQLSWHGGMTTRDVTDHWSLPEGFSRDWAWLITPTGHVQRFGHAAWNSDPIPVPAGSRIVPELTLDAVAARWVNRALPQWLATRRAGSHCRQWMYVPDTVADARMSFDSTTDKPQ